MTVITVVDVVNKGFQSRGVFSLFTKIDNVDSYVVLFEFLGELDKCLFISFNRTSDKDNNSLTLVSVLSMF